MVNRALSLAAVTLLIGGFAVAPAVAQNQNLEAGKSPAQIFAGACNECHKSPRGLMKTVSAGSLSGFLKEHYTTSPDMASLLSSYLISNGASDTRYAARPGKDEKPREEKPEPTPGLADQIGRRLRSAIPLEAARHDGDSAGKPDTDPAGLPQAEPGHRSRNAKRLARSSEPPEATRPAAAEGQVPAQVGGERGPEGRKSAARRGRGRPSFEETPRMDVRREEPAKGDLLKEDGSKGDTGKLEASKPDGGKPPAESKSESADIEPQKPGGGGETPALRPDPVPAVTPAPPAAAAASAAISSGALEPAAEPAAVPQQAVQAAPEPPPPPIVPAGPPAPPISQ